VNHKPPAQPVFQLYRYQILPLSRQGFLPLPGVQSLDDLIARKNEIFAHALGSIEKFQHPKGEIIHRLIVDERDIVILRMGALKKVHLHKRDFSEKQEEDWPSILILINNDPDVQTVAIQLDFKVFRRTRTVAQILEDNLNVVLRRENLGVYFEPQFEKSDFWATVEKYPNRIVEASFDLVSPNMANIRQSLTIDLGALNKSTNTRRTVIELNSDPGATLTLSPEDPILTGLVDYASKGGGPIKLKIQGLRRSITTTNRVKEIIVDELSLETNDPKLLASTLESLLDE